MPAPRKRTRKELIQRVGLELGREISAQTVFFHEMAARKLGLNATDTRCLDMIARAASSQMTAGDLCRATGLTTGAITGILDRLESAALVERFRDASDRRKVFVRPMPQAARKLGSLYQSLGAATLQLVASYSTKDLELIELFLERNLDLLRNEMKAQSGDSARGVTEP